MAKLTGKLTGVTIKSTLLTQKELNKIEKAYLEDQKFTLVNFRADYKNQISNSGHDQHGKYKYGSAGDQGGEWTIKNWYSKPWDCVLRHPDYAVRECIAWLGIQAAENSHIGYDQGNRTSYWNQLKKVKYDPSKIKTNCEADCSAGVAANVKAAGYIMNDAKLKSVSASTTTSTMKANFKVAGFQVLTGSKYLTSSAYLKPGDILLKIGTHAATNLGIGSKVTNYTSLYEKAQTAVINIAMQTIHIKQDDLQAQKEALKRGQIKTISKTPIITVKSGVEKINGKFVDGHIQVSSGKAVVTGTLSPTAVKNTTGFTYDTDSDVSTIELAIIGV